MEHMGPFMNWKGKEHVTAQRITIQIFYDKDIVIVIS